MKSIHLETATQSMLKDYFGDPFLLRSIKSCLYRLALLFIQSWIPLFFWVILKLLRKFFVSWTKFTITAHLIFIAFKFDIWIAVKINIIIFVSGYLNIFVPESIEILTISFFYSIKRILVRPEFKYKCNRGIQCFCYPQKKFKYLGIHTKSIFPLFKRNLIRVRDFL